MGVGLEWQEVKQVQPSRFLNWSLVLIKCKLQVGGMGGRKASIAIGAGTAVPLHADNRAAYRLQ